MNELEAAIDREAADYIGAVIAAVKRAEEEGFTDVDTDAEILAVSPTAYWASYYSIGPKTRPDVPSLFKADSHPYVAKLGADRSYHAGTAKTWDFIRHVLAVADLPLVVYDGVNETVVMLAGRGAPLVALSNDQRAAEIARIASALFAEPWSDAAWTPRAATHETAGIAFTTARAVSPLVAAAVSVRLDAGVWGDDLAFVAYKLHNFQQAIRMNNPGSWFDPSRR